MSKENRGMYAQLMRHTPSGPHPTFQPPIPEGHPCYGCRMFTNPCVYPCNKFREKKIDKTADEIMLQNNR